MWKPGNNFEHPRPVEAKYRPVLIVVAVLALLAAAAFHHGVSMGQPSGAAASAVKDLDPTGRPPAVRLLLGADLWNLFDASLQDRFGHPFPQFSVDMFESHSAVEVCPMPYPHEMILLLPAEKFIANELLKSQATKDPRFNFTAGPDICQTHLVLMMSRKTHDLLTAHGQHIPVTLEAWLQACHATAEGPNPVRFTMAEPGTCTCSWLALEDLVLERLQVDSGHAADIPAGDLSTAVEALRGLVTIKGYSDRIEMYRFLIEGCPDNRVLLVYGHLAEAISASGAFHGYVVATPQLRFQPIVRAIIATRKSDQIPTATYVPTVVERFSRSLPPDMVLPSPGSNAPAGAPVPDYATMVHLLELWKGADSVQP